MKYKSYPFILALLWVFATSFVLRRSKEIHSSATAIFLSDGTILFSGESTHLTTVSSNTTVSIWVITGQGSVKQSIYQDAMLTKQIFYH